jgi:hypothetical protein
MTAALNAMPAVGLVLLALLLFEPLLPELDSLAPVWNLSLIAGEP